VKKLLLFSFVIFQSGCAFFLSYIRDKRPSKVETSEAAFANEFMWEQFHRGNYDSIPSVLEKLNKAYQLDPNDAKVTAHLGYIYLWAFSERIRKNSQDRILENIFLSNRFFKEAIILNPKDARLYGFQSAVQMCEGALTNNLELLAQSYFGSLKAIRKWPAFNKFALGYVESQLDTGSRMYKQGLNYQWEIVKECAEEKLTKEKIMEEPLKVFAHLYKEIDSSKDAEIKRACGNSWIAPHNWEGFFLNFGDMLVKAGKLEEARVIYSAVKISPSYADWIYKDIIDARIEEMNLNVQAFNKKQNLIELPGKRQMMINSEISCAGCHQMSPREFEKRVAVISDPADTGKDR
jgi:hypothetical protein